MAFKSRDTLRCNAFRAQRHVTERTPHYASGSSRESDVLAVWRLDRLGRSLHDLIVLARTLDDAGIGLVSLQEKIDTSSSGGKLIFHIFGALAEFERNVVRERTQAGLSAPVQKAKVFAQVRIDSLEPETVILCQRTWNRGRFDATTG